MSDRTSDLLFRIILSIFLVVGLSSLYLLSDLQESMIRSLKSEDINKSDNVLSMEQSDIQDCSIVSFSELKLILQSDITCIAEIDNGAEKVLIFPIDYLTRDIIEDNDETIDVVDNGYNYLVVSTDTSIPNSDNSSSSYFNSIPQDLLRGSWNDKYNVAYSYNASGELIKIKYIKE